MKTTRMTLLEPRMLRLGALSCALSVAVLACGDASAPPSLSEDESFAAAEPDRRVLPDKQSAVATIPTGTSNVEIVVKFRDGAGIREMGAGQLGLAPDGASPDTATTTDGAAEVLQFQSLAAERGLTFTRVFTSSDETLKTLKERGEQRAQRELADLSQYFQTHWPDATAADVAQLLNELNALSTVELAYVAPDLVAPAASSTTPDFSAEQEIYLDHRTGIDVAAAYRIPGGYGDNVKIIDIEVDWNADHEDLPAPFLNTAADFNPGTADDRSHGTATAGVLVAQHNGFGVNGIVPNAQVGYNSIFRLTGGPSNNLLADAILNATQHLDAGDILLLELSATGPQTATCDCQVDHCNLIPVEWNSAVRSAINVATSNGIVVVEPAGNGSVDLNDPAYGSAFTTLRTDAIMVGSSEIDGSHEPWCSTNFGTAVDVHAHGALVATTGYGLHYQGDQNSELDDYTARFGGTSAAAAIVAGVAASLQSIIIADGRPPLSSVQMRDLLSASGIAQAASSLDRPIGHMPDLGAALETLGFSPGQSCSFGNECEQDVCSDGICDDVRPPELPECATQTCQAGNCEVDTSDCGCEVTDSCGLLGTGHVSFERWEGIGGSGAVSDVPVNQPPDSVGVLDRMEIAQNTGDGYGIRLSGYITAPESGEYRFYVASGQNSQLYLSPNEQAVLKVAIASVTGETYPRAWHKYTSQASNAIYLEAGARHYIEAVMNEVNGPDHLAVGWVTPSQQGSSAQVIPGSQLTPYPEVGVCGNGRECAGGLCTDGICYARPLRLTTCATATCVAGACDIDASACQCELSSDCGEVTGDGVINWDDFYTTWTVANGQLINWSFDRDRADVDCDGVITHADWQENQNASELGYTLSCPAP